MFGRFIVVVVIVRNTCWNVSDDSIGMSGNMVVLVVEIAYIFNSLSYSYISIKVVVVLLMIVLVVVVVVIVVIIS